MNQEQEPTPRCLNCETPVQGKFCVNCGQSTRDVRLSVRALLTEFVDTYFNLNSKLANSLVPMFRQPGFLTRAFIEGRRASYLPPLRLYLVTSILFFLSFSFIMSRSNPEGLVLDTGGDQMVMTEEGFKSLNELSEESDGKINIKTNNAGWNNTDWEKVDWVKTSSSSEKDPEDKKDPQKLKPTKKRPDQGWSDWLGQEFEKRGDKLNDMSKEQVMATFVPLILTMTSRAIFILMPFFALFLKFIYVRRDPLYIDHLIFAFHYHSFLFIFLTALIFWNIFLPVDLDAITALLVLIVPPLYLYKSLRRVYEQSRLRTVLKFGLLWAAYIIMLILAVSISSLLAFWYV